MTIDRNERPLEAGIHTDLSGRIRHCNRRFADLWALPEDLLAQRDDARVFDWMRRSVTDPAGYAQRLAAIAEATLLQASDMLELHSGRVLERIVQPQCSRGRPVGRVWSFRDVTERIRAEAVAQLVEVGFESLAGGEDQF